MRTKNPIETSRLGDLVRYFGLRHAKLWLTVLCLLGLAIPATASAITTISQGFSTNDKIALGSIVSLQLNTSDFVNAATNNNVKSLLGVVIHDGNSLLSLSSSDNNQIQVATSGIVQVLASDINGTISTGDLITASPIGGVGMKATENIKVVGIAQGDLVNANSSSQSYVDKTGRKHSVLMGEVPVLVNVSYYYKQANKTLIPTVIQSMVNALAGKPVNPLPIIISAAVFIVMLIVVVSIIYSMIHSSIISVGRNPMSQSAIYRDLIQLSVLVAGILMVALVSIYIILTRF